VPDIPLLTPLVRWNHLCISYVNGLQLRGFLNISRKQEFRKLGHYPTIMIYYNINIK
jgi:hypothetical protein